MMVRRHSSVEVLRQLDKGWSLVVKGTGDIHLSVIIPWVDVKLMRIHEIINRMRINRKYSCSKS